MPVGKPYSPGTGYTGQMSGRSAKGMANVHRTHVANSWNKGSGRATKPSSSFSGIPLGMRWGTLAVAFGVLAAWLRVASSSTTQIGLSFAVAIAVIYALALAWNHRSAPMVPASSNAEE